MQVVGQNLHIYKQVARCLGQKDQLEKQHGQVCWELEASGIASNAVSPPLLAWHQQFGAWLRHVLLYHASKRSKVPWIRRYCFHVVFKRGETVLRSNLSFRSFLMQIFIGAIHHLLGLTSAGIARDMMTRRVVVEATWPLPLVS